ncbi:hypothetical protein pb186bvf_015765 [Paramecium bursaria]
MKSFQQNIIHVRKYEIDDNSPFDQGVQGKVCKAWSEKFEDRLICAKIIKVNNQDNPLWCKELRTMVEMTKNRHRNLVQILDGFIDEEELCYIIMEELESNLLNDFKIRTREKRWYTFDEVARLIRGLLYGLFELHNNNIIHRDLKPANILIGSCEYVIADFGISEKLDDQIKKNLKFIEGSVKYFCPQIYEKYISNVQIANYTIKSDIYSLGIIFYQLAFQGSFPWQQNIEKNYLEELKKYNFKVKQPQLLAEPAKLEELRLLIEKMLKYKEQDRPGWLELLTHPLVIFQQNILQMNQTSYTKLIYDSILSQLKNTNFFTIKNYYLDAQSQNLLNNKDNLQNKLYVLIIIQITKCKLVEIQYQILKQYIHEMEDLYQELIYIAMQAYVGFVYYRLKRFCFNKEEKKEEKERKKTDQDRQKQEDNKAKVPDQDMQFYLYNNFYLICQQQMNPEFLKIRELIKQQYLSVKESLINYSEKLLKLIINKGQLQHQEYQQLIYANKNGYYQLFQRSLSDFLAKFQFDQIWVKKLNYILNLENLYPLYHFMNQSIEAIQNI